ncbi:hypothetical protein Tco_1392201, partial [Tanacetum coccineum]
CYDVTPSDTYSVQALSRGVTLRKKDVEMTEADQSGADQHNVSQESGLKQEEEDAHVTLTAVHDTQKTEGLMQSSFVLSDFTEKLLNFENVSPADNEIASLMDTTVCHEEPSSQTSTLFSVPTTTIPSTPHFFNPLPQQTTPTPTPTTLEATPLFPALLDFSSVFKFNDKVTKLETDMSEMKQINQYAQAISSIPAIVDRYINNKLGEAIHKAILLHNAECREEAQANKQEYIDLVDSSVRTIIREEVKTQLPQILPKEVSGFATLVIERNMIESLEAAVLARSSSQPKSTYEADASLSEYELTKILLDKMEERKSHLRVDYKRELYDALKDKDQDPSTGSNRGTKRRKSSKDAESSRDPKFKESKSTSSSKGTSRSQHKSSGKSAHAEEPSYIVDDSGVQKNQEFDTGNNDEQPEDETAPKNDWFKKPERPLTPDPDWNKRQQVEFRPPQTWISVSARAKKPPTSFDELMDTLIDFSSFVMNRLNITNLTQELLVGPAFNPLKGTCKSLMELEYHFEEYHRGRQVIPQDYFINNDLEYLKGGSLSRQYLTSITKTKVATYEIKWIEDMVPNLWSPIKVVYDKHAYWGTSHWGVKRQRFYGFASNRESRKDVYYRKRIITVTRLKIMKRYDYGYLDEIEVRREDQQLYTFKEDVVIQRRVEDLQLGVEGYQKKLSLSKPDTFKSNLRNKTAYTAYSDPQGVIYKDQNNINRLMRTNELNKFNDGTLNHVWTGLHDITSGIRMDYQPKRKWSRLDKRRARVLIQDIDK